MQRNVSRVLLVFLVVLTLSWLLGISLLPKREPEIVYLDEKEVILDEVIVLEINQHEQVPLTVEKDDVINITIRVAKGGPIDFFILEEERVGELVDALRGRRTQFIGYERGKKLNTSYASTEFIIVNNRDWVIFLNNYGHIKGGAVPISSVRVVVTVEKIGYIQKGLLSIIS